MSELIPRRRVLVSALAAIPLARSVVVRGAMGSGTPGARSRADAALELRTHAATLQGQRPSAPLETNGDEELSPRWTVCYRKGLPRNQSGEVDTASYAALLAALVSERHADFEHLPRGGGRKQSNPQGAFTYHLEGGDSHTFAVSPPPSVGSEQGAREMAELYWQA